MNTLHDPTTEKLLVNSVEDAIKLTSKGLAPIDAVEKVARDKSLTGEQIKVMTNTFNKARSVTFMKSAKVSKNGEIDIVDPRQVIKRIFSSTEKEASFFLPADDYSTLGLPKISLTKKASKYKTPVITERTLSRARDAYKDAVEKTASYYKTKRLEAKLKLDKAVEDASAVLGPKSDKQLNKIAQLVVNGYPDMGSKMLSVIFTKAGLSIPTVEKTASSAVFPAEEPYLSLNKMYKYAHEFVKAAKFEEANKELQKTAFLGTKLLSDINKSFLGSTLAEGVKLGTIGEGVKSIDAGSVLKPDILNELKKVDTARFVMELPLMDDAFKGYNPKDIAKAYNTAIQIAPHAPKPVLRNLIINNIEGGDVKDIFQMAAEADLEKKYRDSKTVDTFSKLTEGVSKSYGVGTPERSVPTKEKYDAKSKDKSKGNEQSKENKQLAAIDSKVKKLEKLKGPNGAAVSDKTREKIIKDKKLSKNEELAIIEALLK